MSVQPPIAEGGGTATTLDYAARAHLDARRPTLARSTFKNLRYTIGAFVLFTGPQVPIHRVRPAHAHKWLAEVRDQVSPSSYRHYVSALRSFGAWLVESAHLRESPFGTLKAPRAPQSLPRELETENVSTTFFVVPDERGELMVSLMVMEGLRIAEVARLEIGDIDFATRIALVHGKGDKERWVPLTEDTWKALDRYLAQFPASSGPLIRSYSHPTRGVTSGHIGFLVSGWMRKAGVKQRARDGRSAHAFRHTFAGAFLDEGGDIRDLQHILGHANLGATYIYLKRRQATGEVREVMDKRRYR